MDRPARPGQVGGQRSLRVDLLLRAMARFSGRIGRSGACRGRRAGFSAGGPAPGTEAAELRQLLGLRASVAALLEAEAASLDDTPELDRLRRELGRRYDIYIRAYGPVNRFSWRHPG